MTTPGTGPTGPTDVPDDALRDRLRLADPLAGRDPRLDPTSLEVLMSELTDTTRTEDDDVLAAAPVERRRRRWVLPVAGVAAAAAVAAVALAGPLSGVLTGDPATSSPPPTVASRPALVLSVPATDAATAMCMALSPELLAPADYAFDGVVTSVDGDVASLRPTRWYAGGGPTTVLVTMRPEVDTALVGAPRYRFPTSSPAARDRSASAGCRTHGRPSSRRSTARPSPADPTSAPAAPGSAHGSGKRPGAAGISRC